VRVAPDGRRILADARDDEQDVWVGDIPRGTLTRLSFGPSLDAYPVWMPDGHSVLYSSSREGALAVFRQAADGTGTTVRVAPGLAGEGLPVSVTPDAKSAIVRKAGTSGLARSIWSGLD
jgi:Tol biopolymer transport system component